MTLARKAIPLIKAGVKIAAPHAKKAAKNVARELTGQVVQEVAGRIIKPRKPKKRVSKRKNVQTSSSKNTYLYTIMSMIHKHSAECSLSQLEWFCIPPTQTAVEKTYGVDYQPLTAIRDGAPIEFYIPASTEEYLYLKNARLHVTCRII